MKCFYNKKEKLNNLLEVSVGVGTGDFAKQMQIFVHSNESFFATVSKGEREKVFIMCVFT